MVPVICDAMSLSPTYNPSVKEINVLAAKTLTTIIKICWPRIPAYRGRIFQAIAKTWMYYFNKKDETMCSLLKQLYQVFEASCQGQEKADKDALLSFNPSVFKPLFA
ncbi:MAG: hypothetical protein EXX96DRAFT_477003 [Benjaminiella poitrasii]|nr:MAG: hypothetical protein EXX96DRAFT_477003 [Benjaminiella poitrasii]